MPFTTRLVVSGDRSLRHQTPEGDVRHEVIFNKSQLGIIKWPIPALSYCKQ